MTSAFYIFKRLEKRIFQHIHARTFRTRQYIDSLVLGKNSCFCMSVVGTNVCCLAKTSIFQEERQLEMVCEHHLNGHFFRARFLVKLNCHITRYFCCFDGESSLSSRSTEVPMRKRFRNGGNPLYVERTPASWSCLLCW